MITAVLLVSCANTRMILKTAPKTPKGQLASPSIVTTNLSEWGAQRAGIETTLQQEIYGAMPDDFAAKKVSSRLVSDNAFNGSTRVEEIRISSTGTTKADFDVILLTPKTAPGPVPIIVMESFCPNHAVIPIEGLTKPKGKYYDCGGGLAGKVFGYFFGRYITTPPIEMIMEHGYALAALYPHGTYPDNSGDARLYQAASPDPAQPWGAIAAWAYQFSLITDYLDTDERYTDVITYGHSRFGKSALLAAAFDPAIDGVIAHQSGTGGASLSRGKPGETVEDITAGYPHWFTPAYTEDSMSIDQHHLLALIAPRPILLGNAKRDVWSDPNGAFRAAQGADNVYELYGGVGLDQDRLDKMNPKAEIAFWMRPGTHGVVKEDWPAFLEFLDAHFE